MHKCKFSSRKDIKKIIRGIFQGIILIAIIYLIFITLFTFQEYEAIHDKSYENTASVSIPLELQGFVAISYFGVDKTGDDTLISSQRLEEHLKALKNSGFVTITQQDVLDYYKQGKPLPPKSLLLMFEDGRRDTAIFAQKILEKYNFKATMMTYADKFEKKDSKFLSPDDLRNMEDSSYWELGTNGYRLEYINVFDRYRNYLGELDSLEYEMMSSYIDRNYNHYLMDYIRDEHGIPKESYNEMKSRIEHDYEAMHDIYQKELGRLPAMYVLMHSNTGRFGTNAKVSAINEQNIYKLFLANINREGYSYNTGDSFIYDLTRMQPQSFWHTNHLLMRIWDDTGLWVSFVNGDESKTQKWELLDGQAEFLPDSIVLTSMPKGKGMIRLKDTDTLKDLGLSVYLEGNKLGSQGIYLRADKEFKNYIFIQIKNNFLYVKEKSNSKEKEILSLDLNKLDGIQPQSVEENKKESELAALETVIKYSDSNAVEKKAKKELKNKKGEKVNSINDGASSYIPELELKEPGTRFLEVTLENDKLFISIDGKKAVSGLLTTGLQEGYVCLESEWGGYGYSQRNLIDDVYDGVFTELIVTETKAEEKFLFHDKQEGIEAMIYSAKKKLDSIINWFIKTL